ncbi:MAG: SxtJ family membrane protein [Anaeromyxobacter sp.]
MRWIDDVRDGLAGLDQTPRALRRFGLLLGAVALALGAWLLWRGHAPGKPLVALGAALLTLGLAAPLVLGPVHTAWMALALALGWVVSRVLLTAVFFLAVTPLALLARLAGKRFLDLGFDRAAPTYWTRRAPDRPSRLDKMY